MSLPRHLKVSLELVRKIKSYRTLNVIAHGLQIPNMQRRPHLTSASWSNSNTNKKGKKGKESAGLFFLFHISARNLEHDAL